MNFHYITDIFFGLSRNEVFLLSMTGLSVISDYPCSGTSGWKPTILLCISPQGVLFGNFGARMNPGGHRTALQDLSGKLYLCGHKTPFSFHKGNLPTAAHRSGNAAVSPCERSSGKPENKLSSYEEANDQVHQGTNDIGRSGTV